MSKSAEQADPVEEFVSDKREWLTEQAESDMPAAWVCEALLEEYEEVEG